jgi:hypothetical protein
MKLKLTYTSGIKTETVDIGDTPPSVYITERFGGGNVNELVKNGGSFSIVEDVPVEAPPLVEEPMVEEPMVEEVIPVTAPFTVETAADV